MVLQVAFTFTMMKPRMLHLGVKVCKSLQCIPCSQLYYDLYSSQLVALAHLFCINAQITMLLLPFFPAHILA